MREIKKSEENLQNSVGMSLLEAQTKAIKHFNTKDYLETQPRGTPADNVCLQHVGHGVEKRCGPFLASTAITQAQRLMEREVLTEAPALAGMVQVSGVRQINGSQQVCRGYRPGRGGRETRVAGRRDGKSY